MGIQAAKFGLSVIMAGVLVATSAAAAVTPAQKCEAGKNGTVGKYVACLHKAQAKYVQGGEVDLVGFNEATAKCQEKYGSKWTSLEAKAEGACPSNGDSAAIETFVEACVTSAEGALGGGVLPLDVTTCNTNLGTCNTNLGTCNSNLSATNADLDDCSDSYAFVSTETPRWICDPSYYGTADGCDCGCGVVDPDCGSFSSGVCDYCDDCNGCANVDATNNSLCTTTPVGWTCSTGFYNAADGCDCGCGIPDPDCADATAASCDYCNDGGACSYDSCPGRISPSDNSTCF